MLPSRPKLRQATQTSLSGITRSHAHHDKRSRYSGAHRLEEVTLSQFKHFAGQSGAELEAQEAALCLSVIHHLPSARKPGCSTGREMLGQKTLWESKPSDSDARWGQEERERESQAVVSGTSLGPGASRKKSPAVQRLAVFALETLAQVSRFFKRNCKSSS